MEAKKRFAHSGASTSKTQIALTEKPKEGIVAQETYPSVLTYFLQTCMRLLRDQKAVDGLQEIIDNCIGKAKLLPEQHALHKVDKSKKRIGREMRLTAQIGEFEKDQVILYLGSDVNVFP